MLINVGVDVDVASRSGWTIFHYASNSPAMLQLLLDLLGKCCLNDAVFGRVAPKSMQTDYPRVYAPENLGHVFAIPTDDGEGVAA